MDSKVVSREIRREIWSLLGRSGFTQFSSRTAWRFTADQIHVVNFQSFGGYLAEGVGCTTFSFAVNVGIFFRAIPFRATDKRPARESQPRESQCHFRRSLQKGIAQPVLPRRDTWYVESDCSNLLECLDDARNAIVQDGLAWFSHFESLEYVLSALTDQADLPEVPASRESPARKRMIGYIARALGRTELADAMIAESDAALRDIEERLSFSGFLEGEGDYLVGCGGRI